MKQIKNETEVNGEVARELRIALGMTQNEFWSRIGVSQAAACRFETDKQGSMRKPIRTLFFARYISGLNIDATTPEGVRELKRLAKLQKAVPAG